MSLEPNRLFRWKTRENYPDPEQCDWLRPRYDSLANEDDDFEDDWSSGDAVCSAGRLFVDGASASDAAQGTLGDCWLIGALSVLAGREDLSRAMFWGCEDPIIMSKMQKYGIYVCRFMKNFEWYYVITDDRCLRTQMENFALHDAGILMSCGYHLPKRRTQSCTEITEL